MRHPMRHLNLFVAILVLVCFTFLPAAARADGLDDLDVTMTVLDDDELDDLQEMGGPGADDFEDNSDEDEFDEDDDFDEEDEDGDDFEDDDAFDEEDEDMEDDDDLEEGEHVEQDEFDEPEDEGEPEA